MKGATSPAFRGQSRFGVSIHAPNEGSDLIPISQFVERDLFQSTLPMKGATSPAFRGQSRFGVSIHAPNEGSDVGPLHGFASGERFNPRSQ